MYNMNSMLECPLLEGAHFGIELEAEFMADLPVFKLTKWNVDPNEGSLRNGIEWVSHILSDADVSTAVKELMSRLARNKSRVHSPRTSTHVHVNASDLTPEQVTVLACTYSLLEDVIVDTFCPSRKFSNYCYPTAKCFGWLEGIGDLYVKCKFRENEGVRYAGLNYQCLASKGTLECRIFHSAYTSKEMLVYVDLLRCLRNYAVSIPLQQLNEDIKLCNAGDLNPIIQRVFPSYAKEMEVFSKGHEASYARISGFIREIIRAKNNIKKPAPPKQQKVVAKEDFIALNLDENIMMVNKNGKPPEFINIQNNFADAWDDVLLQFNIN